MGLKRIRQNTFMYCHNLVSVTLPEGLRVIDADAFYGCSNLSEAFIPRSVTRIGFNIFRFTTRGKFVINFGGTKREWQRIINGGSIGTFYTCNCIDGVLDNM